MEITIASIDRKEKQSFVHTADGRKLRCWNNKIASLGIEGGGTFEVETDTTDYGTFITKAKKVTGPSGTPTTSKTNGNGHYRPTDPTDAKRIFVCANLTAMIRAGKVENTKESVWATTQLLCQVYDHTFT